MLKTILKNILWGFKLLVIALLLAVFLRVFCFSSYKIPSYSMLPAITGGDYILVNKWILGPRLYKSFDFSDGKNVETRRLKGLRNVKRNDVLVFNFPYKGDWETIRFDSHVFYVKRCVAIPGDTFYIEKGIYKVKNIPDTLGCYQNQIDNWARFQKTGSDPVDETFPFDDAFHWTVLDFGPLYIPAKGDRLTIDTLNIKLYKNLITYETAKNIVLKDGRVYLGEEALTAYTFQKNYYFMTGDYVFDSRDSRYWGMLPEEYIVGKAAIIWKSENPETKKFNWKRFLKRIQ